MTTNHPYYEIYQYPAAIVCGVLLMCSTIIADAGDDRYNPGEVGTATSVAGGGTRLKPDMQLNDNRGITLPDCCDYSGGMGTVKRTAPNNTNDANDASKQESDDKPNAEVSPFRH